MTDPEQPRSAPPAATTKATPPPATSTAAAESAPPPRPAPTEPAARPAPAEPAARPAQTAADAPSSPTSPGAPTSPAAPRQAPPPAAEGTTTAERATAAADRAGEAMEQAAAASGRVATAVIDRLRNDAEYLADRGSTRVEDEVVQKIAGIAARNVAGVHDLGGDTARLFASVKERVGLGEATGGNRGISVRLDGRTAKITVTLVVEYGIQVYPVTEQVRANVIEAVESMLDLEITEVNIVVDDVAAPV